MKKQILAIGLTDNILKILQAKHIGKTWSVDNFYTEKIAGKTEDDISKILKERLDSKKIKNNNIILVIPRNQVAVRYLKLPASNKDELKNMVDIQVVRQIPFSKEEMIYDYHVLKTTPDGFAQVMLVIVHKNIISKYMQILKKANIEPDTIEVDSLSLVELYSIIKGKGGLGEFDDKKPVAFFDIDYNSTNIVIMMNNSPVFTRSVSIGSGQFEVKDTLLEESAAGSDWSNEIDRSLTTFNKEHGIQVDKIILTGDYTNKFTLLIKNKLKLSALNYDCRSLWGGIKLKDDVLSVKGDKGTVSPASLFGVMKEEGTHLINLIPDDIRTTRTVKKKRMYLSVSVLLIAGILGVLGLTLDKKINERKVYLAYLQKNLTETNPVAEELEIKRERLNLIKKQLSVAGSSLDLLRELYGIIPAKTSLNVFIYDDAHGVTIKGASPAMSEVFELIPKIENSDYFESVTSKYATQRRIKGQEITEFHIDCLVEKPEES